MACAAAAVGVKPARLGARCTGVFSSRAVSASAAAAPRAPREARHRRRGLRRRRRACREQGAKEQRKGESVHCLTLAMIGVVRKDRGRPEQLLRKHRPREQMRPGRRPRRAAAQRPRRCVSSRPSAANQESRLAPAAVAPGFQLFGGLIEESDLPARRGPQCGSQQLLGHLAAAVGNSVTFVGQAIRFK